MATISVSSIVIPNIQVSISSLRIYVNRSFVSSAGIPIEAGDPSTGLFYKNVVCTLAGTDLTIASLTLDSTVDGSPNSSRYSAYFFDANGVMVAPYEPFTSFAIPIQFDGGLSASWSGINAYNSAIYNYRDFNTYTTVQIDAKIAAINAFSNPLTQKGDLVVAVSGGALMRLPVGANDTLLVADSAQTLGVKWAGITSTQITTGLGYTPLNRAGDTMTGLLTLSGAPTNPLHAATKAYVDAGMTGMGAITSLNGLTGLAFPTQTFAVGAAFPTLTITSAAGAHTFNWSGALAAIRGGSGQTSFTKGDLLVASSSTVLSKLAVSAVDWDILVVDAASPTGMHWVSMNSAQVTGALGYTPLNRAGDTMLGPLILSGAPTLNLHAATKLYVDTTAAAAAGAITTLNTLTGAAFPSQTFAVGGNFPNLTITSAAGAHTFNWTGQLAPLRGGTGLSTFAAGDIIYASSSSVLVALNIGGAGMHLRSNGTTPAWSLVALATDVSGILPATNGGTGNGFTAFSGPTTSTKTFALPDASATILTSNTAVTAPQGGTGIASYTIGDTLYANSTSSLAKLTIGSANTVLHSNGTSPSWGLVVLTTDVSGILPLANGGTGASSLASGYIKSNGSVLSSQSTPIPVADGGTGAATLTAGGVLYGTGTTAIVATAQGAAGTVFIGGATPSFTTSPTITNLTISSLTANSVLFAGTAGLISQNNSRFAWDNSAFRLLINGTLRLQGSTSGTMNLMAAAVTTTDRNFVFPPNDGTNGYVLATDGAGNTSWISNGGGGSAGVTSLNGVDGILTLSHGSLGSGAADLTVVAISATELRVVTPDAATGTARGLMTNATQSLAGDKTWTGASIHQGMITLAAGTTTLAPIRLQAGVVLTTPVAHTFEWDGTNGFLTTSAAARKTIAFIDSNITGSAASITGNLTGDVTSVGMATSYGAVVPLAKGGTGSALSISGTTGMALISNGTTVAFSSDGTGLNISASNLSTGMVPLARITGLTVTQGAVGITSYALGNTLYASGSSTLVALAPNITTTQKFMAMTGDGSVGAAPVWTALILGDLPAGTELTSRKDAASGYAGLTAGTKINLAQIQEVISITDTTTYGSTSGTGTTALLTTITAAATGDMIVRSAGGDWVNAPPSAAAAHNMLSLTHSDSEGAVACQTGALIFGSDAATPLWSRFEVGTVGHALRVVAGSNGNVPEWGLLSLTASVTGTLPVANGGTGMTAGVSGGIPYFSTTSTQSSSLLLAANGVVLGGGAGSAPFSTAAGTAGMVLRIPTASTVPGLGSIDLAHPDAVGTSVLRVLNGGTNIASYAVGDLLYASGTTTLTKLGIGTALQYLRTNAGATAPEWATLTATGTVTHTAGALTANSFIFGNGTDDIKATAAATNGQLLIGSTGVNPVAAALTGTANRVTVTNGAGSITLDIGTDVVTLTGSQVLTSKTLTTPTIVAAGFANMNHTHVGSTTGGVLDHVNFSNIGTNTHAQIDTHIAATAAHGATGAVVGTTNAQTLTNKTLTAPVIATIVNTGTLTLPTSTDTLVGKATTDVLTNKTLTSPVINVTSDATGDLYYRNGSGLFTRLGIGTALQQLRTNAGATAPEWATISGGSGTVTHTAGALTANSFLFGNGTDDIKATAAATNGQLLIGSTGVNPVAAALTGTANQITVTNGAGSITLSTPQSLDTSTTFQVAKLGISTGTFGTQTIFQLGTHITADTVNRAYIRTGAAGNSGLVIQGETSQTADLFICRNVGGTPLFQVNSAGMTSQNNGVALVDVSAAQILSNKNVTFAASTTSLASSNTPAGAAPTTPVEGDSYNDSTQKSMVNFVDGIKQMVPGVLYVSTNTVTIANTTTETSFIGAGIGTLTLPANFFVAGKSIWVRAWGDFDTNVTTFAQTIRFKLGGVTVATLTFTGIASQVNAGWSFDAIITCRTTGAGGTAYGNARLDYSVTTLATDATRGQCKATAAGFAMATNGTLAVAATQQWTAAAADSSFRCYNFMYMALL